jgi:hypothetical protein
LIARTVVERGVSDLCASNEQEQLKDIIILPELGAADNALRVDTRQAEEEPGEEEAPAASSCQAETDLDALRRPRAGLLS